MTIRINRTAKTSPSARTLATALNTKLLRTTGSTWRGKPTDVVINWGSTTIPTTRALTLNLPIAVANSVDKLTTFRLLSAAGINIPRYYVVTPTTDMLSLLPQVLETTTSRTLLFRTTATGHGGEGIHVHKLPALPVPTDYVQSMLDLPFLRNTKFISEYFPASEEYRIHVAFGQPILSQRKALRTDDQRPTNPDFTIRNHANGFVFTVTDVNPPQSVLDASTSAVRALGLHFGAVDIRYNPDIAQYCVLEVNSAPALQGTTLERYVAAFTMLHSTTNSAGTS